MTPRPGRRAAIVGVAESDVGATPHLTVLSQQALAAQAALHEAGLAKDTVDAVFTAGAWSWAPTMTLAEYLGIQPRYTDSTNIGGSSFEAHAGHAAAAIEAGLIDVALITYGSTQRTSRSRNAPRPAELTAQFERRTGCPCRSARTRWPPCGTCTSTAPPARTSPRSRSRRGSGRGSTRAPGTAIRSPSRTCWPHR